MSSTGGFACGNLSLSKTRISKHNIPCSVTRVFDIPIFWYYTHRKIFKYQFFGIIMDLDKYLKRRLASKIVETELERYLNFFENTYKENLEHCKFVINDFPRWGIVSGYYAMHDITKLFLAKKFSIKIDFNVHKTTLDILKEVIEDKNVLKLLKTGYKEFIEIANDLAKARRERTKAQYYTGTEFMKEKYKIKADEFLNNIVVSYINKINEIIK